MSTNQLSSFCLKFDSRGRMHELYVFFSVDFLLQSACSSLTPRSCWFIEALQSIKDNDLVHLEFPISPLQCFSVFRMILATVIGLRSKSDRFYNSWPRKIKLFSIGGICDINNKGWKISGVAWTLLDAEEHRMIMATRHKFSRLSLRLTAKDSFCMNTYSEPRRA